MPKYFAGDYFQRIPWIGYEHAWQGLTDQSYRVSSAE